MDNEKDNKVEAKDDNQSTKLYSKKFKDINRRTFENLCGIQCTQEEICAVLDVSQKTLEKWVKRTYGETYSVVYKAKRGTGRVSLRRTMWETAQDGNTTLQIFLAKNFLGMSDHVKVEASADGKLADLIDGLKEPINDLHTEATSLDGIVADEQT